MKKLFSPVAVLTAILIIIASACNNKELERLKAENDSLKNVMNENNAQLEQYTSALAQIQENLNTIKQKEHIIDMATTDSTEITPDVEEQINNDITTIYQLMQQNEEALATLKKQLRSSGYKNKQLEQQIATYEQMLKQKDEEIQTLTQKLQQMNLNMDKLNEQIEKMQSSIDTLQQVQQEQNQKINEQDQMLHTVYYVVGTKDELIQHHIISKSGILSKLSVDPNFDKSYFLTADDRDLDFIPINAKKVQILTKHPDNSYSLVQNDDKIYKGLKITNKDAFWNVSRFCVILTK